MGQIDLKYASLTVEDGTIINGAVNLTGGYTTGATTMLISGLPTDTVLADGIPFTITGETGSPIHNITAHTETAGVTTSITFAPGLASTIADSVVLTFGPNALTLHIGEGDLTWTEHRNIIYVTDRGLLAYTRLGDQTPTDVAFEFIWDFITSNVGGGEPPTMSEALKQIGACSTWVSSAADKCQPYAVNVIINYIPPCPGIDREIITVNDFRYEELDYSAKDAKVSVKGKANVQEVSSVREAQ
jgi:hypothetical protein